MKAKKKIIICCDSKEEGTSIKKQVESINSSKEKEGHGLVNKKLFPLLDALDKNVQTLWNHIDEIKKGKIKADEDALFSNIYPETKTKMPDYKMFQKVREEYGTFEGNDWVKLIKLKNILYTEKTITTCCSYAELNYIKKINDYDGIVVPCELSWDAERIECDNTQYAGISLVQRLREDGVVIPVIFTSFAPREAIIKARKDVEIIRTPALQHKFLDMLKISGWKDIFRSFDDMRPLNQAELRYTQMLYCSLRGLLVQVKHSISSCSNKDEYRSQIKYVLDKKFNDDEDLMMEFNQTDNLELFCQKLIDLMDNPNETVSHKDEGTEFMCNDEEKPITIAYLEDNKENDRNAGRFVDYINEKNDEIDNRNKDKEEEEQKEMFRFARVKVMTTKEELEKKYKDYDVIIVDIDIKNKNNEVVAIGFEVVRHLIEDLGAYNHVYYIVTNVTRSFYDQIKIPGINRIRLKEEALGTDERINRFLYGIKEAVDNKQEPKSDCQYIFDKLYAYIKNEKNYPIGYMFNYMKILKEEQKKVNSFNEFEKVVRNETAKLVHVFLLGIKDFGMEDRNCYNVFDKACKVVQVHIGGDKEKDKKDNGMFGRGNGHLVQNMMKKKTEAPTYSNVNAFMVRLILRRFFLYIREFVKLYNIKTIGEKQNGNGMDLSIDDLACRAIGPSGAYKEYDKNAPSQSQSKCLTETLMLTEKEEDLENMLTEEEKEFIKHLNEFRSIYFDDSQERRIEAINFNY